ncbi:TRAP transporter small permease subunit, partial [Pseudomonas sp. CrR25]|nr:TRAP transporter small permease subunit [Pseudomonas sp. CrR25]
MSDKPPLALRIAHVIDAINTRFGQGCAWLTLFLVIGTAIVVILRYGFGVGATALQEAVLYAHAMVFMGASAWALIRNAHVRVDIFYQKFSGRRQALVETFGNLLFLLPLCLYLGWSSWDYVANSWATLEASS